MKSFIELFGSIFNTRAKFEELIEHCDSKIKEDEEYADIWLDLKNHWKKKLVELIRIFNLK